MRIAFSWGVYAEFPSIQAAQKRKKSSYHFHDDVTHKSFYIIEELANIAIFSGCKIISCGPISIVLKNVLSPLRAFFCCLTDKPHGSFLLHSQKKIDHIFVERSVEFLDNTY